MAKLLMWGGGGGGGDAGYGSTALDVFVLVCVVTFSGDDLI